MTPTSRQEFDWVKARAECSVDWLFEQLCAEAAKNVATANNITKGPASGHKAFSITANSHRLTVTRNKDADEVAFEKRGSGILIAHAKEGFSVGVDLDDSGECVAVVDGAVLKRWQVLRRALGRLFFEEAG